VNGPLVYFRTHLREGMHALCALVAFRQDERAHDLAERCIAAIDELWSADTGWDNETSKTRYGLEPDENALVSGLARIIGPLVNYFRVTRSPCALGLALRIKERLLLDTFVEDGRYDLDIHGAHTHSTTGVMSSLAQLAELTRVHARLTRVRAFYDNGLKDISDPLGWVIETSRDDQNPGYLDRGEINNTGDIVETALILRRHGWTEYFEDAERIFRSHLLPSQRRDIDFIEAPPFPDNVDRLRDVAARHQGAFGFPAPYGHEPICAPGVKFNMDIVVGGVGTLCEAYRDLVRFDETGHHVNLLFDRHTDAIKVASPYSHACLAVTLKQPGTLWVRIPSWVDVEQMHQVPGAQVVDRHLFVGDHPVAQRLELPFELTTREITLHHRSRDIGVRLRGDAVDAMQNLGADLTFFPAL